eukprot:scaffold33097_cov91-Cyclotella_meneghiniana.AAC.5
MGDIAGQSRCSDAVFSLHTLKLTCSIGRFFSSNHGRGKKCQYQVCSSRRLFSFSLATAVKRSVVHPSLREMLVTSLEDPFG